MKHENRNTGRFGEDLAVEELKKKGYEILERNFSNKFGEIDIIAKHKNIFIFVEVKTKKGELFGTPEEMINPKKLYKIKNMATIFLKGKTVPCRIDIVAIVLSPENELVRLTHYESVY